MLLNDIQIPSQWPSQQFDAGHLQIYWSVVHSVGLIPTSCAAGQELAG